MTRLPSNVVVSTLRSGHQQESGRVHWVLPLTLSPSPKTMSATQDAFEQLRKQIGDPRLPPESLIVNADQRKPMAEADGLRTWADGTAIRGSAPVGAPPLVDEAMCSKTHLWVVRPDDVVYAEEHCEYGKALESKVIKHTNLTGGAAAFSGGELLCLEPNTVILNGCSGRYGPKSAQELDAAARAFAQSGYGVWSMGWDEDVNRPAPFIGITPVWLS